MLSRFKVEGCIVSLFAGIMWPGQQAMKQQMLEG